jgi:hypothetical protein
LTSGQMLRRDAGWWCPPTRYSGSATDIPLPPPAYPLTRSTTGAPVTSDGVDPGRDPK